MQYLVNISSICTNDLQKKKVPNFKIVIILEMLISILLYRKQEQFLTTIVFLPTAIQLWNGLSLETKCI